MTAETEVTFEYGVRRHDKKQATSGKGLQNGIKYVSFSWLSASCYCTFAVVRCVVYNAVSLENSFLTTVLVELSFHRAILFASSLFDAAREAAFLFIQTDFRYIVWFIYVLNLTGIELCELTRCKIPPDISVHIFFKSRLHFH